MTVTRVPGASGPVNATVNVPGSKSVANRALLCAALVPGRDSSRVRNIPAGDDCVAMVEALASCGAVSGDVVTGGIFPAGSTRFDAGIAGTTSRFLTAAAALSPSAVTIDGGEPLRRRPMADLHDALRDLGAVVEPVGGAALGHIPVRVSGGDLAGGAVSVRGDVSSQFISALMLVAPRMRDGLVISVTEDLVSRPYVEMTAEVMRRFGADVSVSHDAIHVLPVAYRATDYDVEPDFSSAAFAVMSLVFTNGRMVVPKLRTASMQGDSYILEVAQKMGLDVSADGDDIVVSRAEGVVLSPINVNLADASDLVPAVAVACTAIPGRSTITGVGFIRAKESDRLGDLAMELNMAGARVTVDDDGLTIEGGTELHPTRPFGTHHDHRLAMAFSMAAAGGSAVEIADSGVVSKSWPTFFSDMAGVLGAVTTLN